MSRASLREKVRLHSIFSNQLFSIIGQDHTLWSWGSMMHDGEDEIYIYTETVDRTLIEINETQEKIDEFWNGITSTEVSH